MSGRNNLIFFMHADGYDFSRIEKYFARNDHRDVFQVISDRTVNDLDLHEVFQFADHASSKVGQQYLYNSMRTIPESSERISRLEKLISVFSSNEKLAKFAVRQISRLSRKEAYYISSLFNEAYIERPKWFWVIQVLCIVTLFLLVSLFFVPRLFIAFVVILLLNTFIHYWNKRNLYQYASSILQLLILTEAAEKLNRYPEIRGDAKVKEAIAAINGLGYKMTLFKLEAKLESDIGLVIEHLLEIIKSIFLIEPLMLFRVIRDLDARKMSIKTLFDYVGEIDAAMAVMTLRNQLQFFCRPDSIESKCLDGKDLYHPLILNCVANSISLNNKSALFTGSNMSGKTTFIRVVGINGIFAQTLNTCFAKKFSMPKAKIFSGIRISDNVSDEKSYYAEEAATIKEMIAESRKDFQSIFLLDELFKGTNTVERIAAGKAVLDYLNASPNLIFISTHDLELVDYLSETFNCYHFTEIIVQESILFDYKIKEGVLKTTNAIRLLELFGFPMEIIIEAKHISSRLSFSGLKVGDKGQPLV